MANNKGWLIVSWIVLVVISLLVLTQNTTWGMVFVAIVIVVKVVTRQKEVIAQNNPEKILCTTETINKAKTYNLLNTTSAYISKDYFLNITQEVEKIVSFYEHLCCNNSFLVKLNECTYLKITINGITADSNEKIRTFFLVDMIRCLIDLGHELNFKNKEGFGLFYFWVRTNGLGKFGYDQLGIVLKKESVLTLAEKYAAQIKSAIKTNLAIDEIFIMSKILGEYDSDKQQKYLILLYRYASLTAKADGFVNEKEAEWLSKILSLSQNKSNGRNIIVSDKENKKVKAADSAQQTRAIKPQIANLKSLIGLTSVKEEIETLTNFIKIQQAREAKGLKTSSVSYHCVFTGNPGTGKTTVARIVADIYKSLGILAKGHLVETDRSGLVAEYVGQTAVKTNRIIDTALDGVLFIDEAYSLMSKSDNDYGKETIATLLKRMEDNRDRLVVILAGYSEEMQQFIDSNPGLQSRFNRYIEFLDYSAEELYQIFEMNAKQFDYAISKDAESPLKEYLVKKVAQKDKNFGNARFVRNLFEKTIERQANRLSKEVDLTDEKLSEICSIDIPM
jgi:AAA+ superfamily predicted ATPase